MHSVPALSLQSINGMTGLKERPVFFLKVNGAMTPNVVVKGELRTGVAGASQVDAEVSIKWSAKLMKNVNNSLVNTKIMDHSEINAFCQTASRAFAPGTPQYNRVTAERANFIWTKMPFVPGLSDADVFTAQDKIITVNYKAINLYEMKKVKSALGGLLNEQAWMELGKIVAVDVFNGNGDRFDPDTGAWVNKGNIMFLQNGQTAAIGLDSYHAQRPSPHAPGGAFSNLNVRGNFDSLKILSDHGYRQNFATTCLRSVGKDFKLMFQKTGLTSMTYHMAGPASPKITITGAELPNFFVQTFLTDYVQGLAEGSRQLKDYLQRKLREYSGTGVRQFTGTHRNQVQMPGAPPARPGVSAPTRSLPPGVMARMQYLGWL